MQTSVNLQEPYRYTLIPLLCVIAVIIAITIYVYFSKRPKSNTKIEEVNVKKIPEKNIKNIPVIKDKYLRKLDDIEDKYNSNKVQLRQAYQLISEAIRLFIFEVTDISTQNYSLAEIKKLNIPVLYELIEEYYEPEFALKPIGDFSSSISKARSVIVSWK